MRSTISAISSANRLATTAVTAGISSTAPARSPTPSANAMIQPSTASVPWAHGPSATSSQAMPVPDSHSSSRNSTMTSDHEKRDGEPDRLEQHRAERRREHLVEGLEYRRKHRVALRAESQR